MNNISHNLQRLVKDRNITMAGLARATGIAPQTLNNWRAGQEPRSISQLKRVADYFEVSLDYLCFGKESMKKEIIEDFSDEINAGVFEVVLRRVKTKR